jgi:hypothetical protein
MPDHLAPSASTTIAHRSFDGSMAKKLLGLPSTAPVVGVGRLPFEKFAI